MVDGHFPPKKLTAKAPENCCLEDFVFLLGWPGIFWEANC